MKIAHLILTYTNPHQTERMIKAMYHPDFDFYIHVDKKINIIPHLFLEKHPNVYFIENREEVRWAGYNTVKATFNCIYEIVNSGKEYAFINFLSGQDYPLKPADELMSFFEDNIGREFLSYKDYVNDWTEGLYRVGRFSLVNYRFKGKHRLEGMIGKLFAKRQIPYGMHPYGDSMFWMLSPEAAKYVADTVTKDKKLTYYFKHTWGGDEFIFQTILLNSPFKDKVVNNNFRYIDWSAGGAHPKVFGKEDFEALHKSGMLFARKFNDAHDKEIFDLLDNKIIFK